ncbi:MAG: hypothetical protein GKS06_09890 [Acidobacteria bacterium]|nr:hypothetical protein [Acidobacteriota bacterium]
MNRKDFLRLAGGAAAASAIPRPMWANPQTPQKNWVWVRGDLHDVEPWKADIARWRASGIHAALFEIEDAEALSRIIPAARAEGIEPHVWIHTMMQRGAIEQNPEWGAVNRSGDSTATDPPYVEYYRFMCPTREPVRRYLVDRVERLAALDGLASVQLDYIRVPDVILPRQLWEQYGLVQDREHPEFDYCYCDVCRARFREQTGDDPLDLPDPPADERWLQFRYDAITAIVNELADVAHGADKQLTAAVFPTPTIAKQLVRQDWLNWNVDAVLPMLYQSFYLEPVDWIEEGAREGVTALAGRIPLYAGLYVPELTPAELAQAVEAARAGGAAGISLFESRTPTDAHWRELAAVLNA